MSIQIYKVNENILHLKNNDMSATAVARASAGILVMYFYVLWPVVERVILSGSDKKFPLSEVIHSLYYVCSSNQVKDFIMRPE